MSRLSFPQKVAALGLAAALTVSWVSAAPTSRQDHPSARRAATPMGLAQQLLSLWVELLDEGCHLDPSGHCGTATSAETLDAGCHADPNGICTTAASHAAPTETLDEGCHADPSGGCAGGSW